MLNLNTMKKDKKYTITVMRWDAEESRYVKTLVILSVAEATQLYEEAVEGGDQATIYKACADLNAIREQAGDSIPVC